MALVFTWATAAQADVPYQLYLVPTSYDWLDQSIRQHSILADLIRRPPLTNAGLRRRIKRDKKQLTELLRSEGFYAGHVSIIRTRGSKTSAAVADENTDRINAGLITIAVDPGPAFKYDRFALRLNGLQPAERKSMNSQLPKLVYQKGLRAQSKGVLETESKILRFLADNAFPFAKVDERRVEVDHATRTLSTELRIEMGPKSTLGGVRLEGVEKTNPAFIRERLGLKEGRFYSQTEIDSAKRRLLNTGLFTNVTIRKPDASTAYGVVPLTVDLKEKKKRQVTISAGASLKNGPLASIEWRHRDLFGKAQNLSVKLQANRDQISTDVTFEWPNFFRDDQILTAGLSAAYEDINDINTTSVDAKLTIGRWYRNQKAFFTFGPEVEYLKSQNAGVTTETYLASLPITMELDQSNDLLDPEKGFRLSANLTPFINLKNLDEAFLKTEAGVAAYLQLQPNHKLTMAAWLKGGAIFGEQINAIPVTKRFYLGGAGSLRGFGNKEISASGQVGGVAKIEGGLELRRRFTDTVGGVAFIEAGQIYDDLSVSTSTDLHASAGVGVRYFSNFGPVRADAAFPISRSPEFSDVEISVGLGQAF